LRYERDKIQREVMAPYNNGSSTTYLMKKWTDQLQSYTAPRERVKGLFKQQTQEELERRSRSSNKKLPVRTV
jgi:hypothetical protein